MSMALALLPLAHGLLYFVISASLFGLGFGAAQPATMALLIDRVRPDKRGLASGTYYTGFDAGVSAGSILLGAVSQHLGFAVMWPIAAVCTLMGLAGFLADRRLRFRIPDSGFQIRNVTIRRTRYSDSEFKLHLIWNPESGIRN